MLRTRRAVWCLEAPNIRRGNVRCAKEELKPAWMGHVVAVYDARTVGFEQVLLKRLRNFACEKLPLFMHGANRKSARCGRGISLRVAASL